MTDVRTPLLELVSAPPVERIADYLLSLLPEGRPRRLARMSYPGEMTRDRKTGALVERGKYQDISGALTRSMLVEHAAGAVTYSYMLDLQGKARVGAFDVDQGGRVALQAALAAGRELGLTLFAIVLPGEQHDGGHVFAIYDAFYPAADIRAQMLQVVERAQLDTKEIWPGYNQGIRGLFGKHQTKGTRGELLSQAGEMIDLDSDLAAGFDLVLNLPTNTAPPPAPAVEKPQTSDKTHYAIRQSPGERAALDLTKHQDGRIDVAAIGRAVRERFNAENDWSDLLESAGGARTRDGWACNCGWQHTHDTQIAVTSKDKIVSFSHNCSWAPHKDSGVALDKFGFYCLTSHNNNYSAARDTLAKAYGLWVEPQRPAAPTDTQCRTQAQAQDAERKRAQRLAARQERIARIDPLIDQLDQDSAIYPFARDVFAYHLACWSSAPEHYASVERITRDVLGLDRAPTENEYRRVQLAHQRLIERGYIKRTVRGSKAIKETNCWQPGVLDGVRVIRSVEAVEAHQEAENEGRITLIIQDSDLISNSVGSSEAPPEAPPPENVYADSLDCWAWSEAEHGADELTALEYAPAVEPEECNIAATLSAIAETAPAQQQALEPAEQTEQSGMPPAPAWRLVCDKRGMWSLRGPNAECEWLGRDENKARLCWALKNLSLTGQTVHVRDDVLVSPLPPENLTKPDVEPLADLGDGWRGFDGGAAFNPNPPAIAAQPVERPEPGAPVIIELDPLEQAPPLATDATYGKFISFWYASQPGSICRRTGKPYSASQRAYFKREHQQLLVDVSPAEAALRWEALRQRGRSTRQRQARGSQAPSRQARPSGAGLQVALL